MAHDAELFLQESGASLLERSRVALYQFGSRKFCNSFLCVSTNSIPQIVPNAPDVHPQLHPPPTIDDAERRSELDKSFNVARTVGRRLQQGSTVSPEINPNQ